MNKKLVFNIVSCLTGFVLVFCGALHIDGFLEKLIEKPLLMVLCVGTAIAWCLLLLGTFIALLIKENWREEAFLTFAGTKADDELEEKAINDAIKKTFLMNLLILVSLILSSGFTYTKIKSPETEKSHFFSYRLMNNYTDLTQSIEKFSSMKTENPKIKEGLETVKKMADGKHYFLVPKLVFSPYGALCFIVLQFITFRIFLYFNRRKFLEE